MENSELGVQESSSGERVMKLAEESELEQSPVRSRMELQEESEGEAQMQTPESILADQRKALEGIEFKMLGELEALDNLLEEEDATEEDIKKQETKVERLRKQIKVKEDAIRIMEKKIAKEESRTDVIVRKKSEKVVVPSGMPKFRQGGHLEEPTEFLDAFINVMSAHEIPMERYGKLLILCLDSVDGQWLKIKDVEGMSWTQLEEEFVAHFQHPNAVAVWQEKIRNLRMEGSGVQRYTDQFIRLAQRLKWDLKGEVAVYQYKQGLPEWIADRISTAEAAVVLTGERKAGVEDLGRMALFIEASKKTSKEAPKWKDAFKPRSRSVQCNYCHKEGHLEADCGFKKRDAARKQWQSKPFNSGSSGIGAKAEAKTGEVRTENKSVNMMTCHRCGGKGHWARDCTSQKNVKALSVGKEEADNKPKLRYEEVSQFLEVPCLINGKKVFGLLDTGANVSVIDMDLVHKFRIKVEPAKGIINQAFEGNKSPRIGVVRVMLEAGKKKLKVDLEVARLSGETKLIIGMDLFNKLDFKLSNIPIMWPEPESDMKIKSEMKIDKKEELPSGIDSDRIAKE